jgi:transposase InsO family protein
VKTFAVEYPIAELCQVLEVSRSGYYAWLKRQPSQRQLRNQALLLVIAELYRQSRLTYGSPRITRELNKRHQPCGRNRVARLMRQAGLRACQSRAFRPRTTDSNHRLPVAANLLKDNAPPTGPNQVWTTDITYVHTEEGWLYLAAVMDLYSRKIVGWATADHLKTSLPAAALQQALDRRRPPAGLIHHSDRGVQYASEAYQNLLQARGLVPSMSAAGHCYDNATMESFFSSLKRDLIHRQPWQTHQEVQSALFEYLETFYNRWRLHSALNYRSPVAFEACNHTYHCSC